uniref:hypothetical protein n=1 Tax=Helicobacter pylori TaxID=210 RepID=UPI0037C17073
MFENLNNIIQWVAIMAAVASVILVIYSFATRSVMEPKTGSLVGGIVGFIAAGLIFVLSGGVVTFRGIVPCTVRSERRRRPRSQRYSPDAQRASTSCA